MTEDYSTVLQEDLTELGFPLGDRKVCREPSKPPWRQPRGKWMVSLVHSHTDHQRWHLWEIDLRFALNSTPGWVDQIENLAFGLSGGPLSRSLRIQRRALQSFDTIYLSISFRKSPPPQNRQLNTLIGNSEKKLTILWGC